MNDGLFNQPTRFSAVTHRTPSIAFTLHELGQGGTDRVSSHLARGFVEAGFNVELIVLFGGAAATSTMLSLSGERVSVQVLSAKPGSRHIDRLAALPRLVSRLRKCAPDVVISTGNNMNWITALAFLLARLESSRLVLKITNPVIRAKDGLFRRLYRRMRYRHAFAQSDMVLTLCDREAGRLRTAFPATAARVRSVVNPYVTPAMLNSRHESAEGERDTIVAIGRLAPQKRFDLLIHAFARIQAVNARLVILGEGPQRRPLQALVRELGLGDRVAIPGYVADVGPWLRRARLFALSSRYEGLPAVVLEAMAYECPVVATDCFLAAETLIGSAQGCALVDEATPAAFARAMDRCWASPRPTTLSGIAERFSIAEGVRSHVEAVRALLSRASHDHQSGWRVGTALGEERPPLKSPVSVGDRFGT